MKKTATALACLLGMLALSSTAHGEERQQVCAKYLTRSGWSKPYEVNATITDGFELNQKTQSIRFNSIAKYVVIFWAQHEASVIQLQMPFLSVADTAGVDQEDRQWAISTGGFCY